MVRRAFVSETQDTTLGEAAVEPGQSALRQETEAESILGPDVRSPVGIPKDYKPLESSNHELFRIDLEGFGGPLDLLLYLIKKHDIDVFDIPIKFITEQYLALLDALEALSIDVAAEFLVLASELAHIKSKMLLPAREGVAVENDEIELDPREELVRRLLEYQKYRDAAGQLSDRDQLGRDVFARVPSTADSVGDLDPGLKSVSVFKLVELMASLIKRDEGHHTISFEEISIGERIEYVLAFGDARDGKFSLTQLLQGIPTRRELVVTFIAVLEMTRLGLIRLLAEDDDATQPAHKETESLEEAIADHESQRPHPAPAEPALPVIWVRLTGKKLTGEIRDDYR